MVRRGCSAQGRKVDKRSVLGAAGVTSCPQRRRAARILVAGRSPQDEDVRGELQQISCVTSMPSYVRDPFQAWEGTDFRLLTTAVGQVLDELNSLEHSPWDPNCSRRALLWCG